METNPHDHSLALIALLADGEPHERVALARALAVDEVTLADLLGALARTESGVSMDGETVRLAGTAEVLARERIVGAMACAIPGRLVVAGVVSSTNTVILDNAAEWPSGSFLLAEGQTAGRGRAQRRWHSPLGTHVYLSAVYEWRHGLAALTGITPAIGVALGRALRAFGAPVMVKWPNDLLVEGRKLAGILVETRSVAQGGVRVVVGVGVNVGEASRHADVGQPSVCLNAAAGQVLSRNRVAAAMVDALIGAFGDFEAAGLTDVLADWSALDYFRGAQVEVTAGRERTRGVARGIDARGRLLLEVAGELRALNVGEVSLRAAAERMPS